MHRFIDFPSHSDQCTVIYIYIYIYLFRRGRSSQIRRSVQGKVAHAVPQGDIAARKVVICVICEIVLFVGESVTFVSG